LRGCLIGEGQLNKDIFPPQTGVERDDDSGLDSFE
jgi:hypothetical protein